MLVVSVSSCGSSWFLGPVDETADTVAEGFSILLRIELVFGGNQQRHETRAALEFQYPLADRVGFWGPCPRTMPTGGRGFSILLRIELVFGVEHTLWLERMLSCFSILLRIELVFGERLPSGMLRYNARFSILLRIELVFGACYRQPGAH